MTPLRWRT